MAEALDRRPDAWTGQWHAARGKRTCVDVLVDSLV